ncbi:regulatory protein RecX [Shewanella sp. AS16]|uniref:regulatory protein RecX n=1 Tax=Shewanella sp. AS16 TaxID=2907625 RepID=UPI003FA3A4E7
MSQSARQVAVALLARRDYSRHEIKAKLLLKGFETVEIESVLDGCEASGFLDDNRYADLLLRSHITKGHGLGRIKQAMAQKGLCAGTIAAAVDRSSCDWFELAKSKAVKKYTDPRTQDMKEKARRIRFLMGQGFSYDQIAYALDYDPYDESSF